jgi:hypothetical protein
MNERNATNRSREDQIPLSLGKASLRIRLEAYYSLISPNTLSNRTEWLQKYDQIYEKVSNEAISIVSPFGVASSLVEMTDVRC